MASKELYARPGIAGIIGANAGRYRAVVSIDGKLVDAGRVIVVLLSFYHMQPYAGGLEGRDAAGNTIVGIGRHAVNVLPFSINVGLQREVRRYPVRAFATRIEDHPPADLHRLAEIIFYPW